jgi:hypothetical protein
MHKSSIRFGGVRAAVSTCEFIGQKSSTRGQKRRLESRQARAVRLEAGKAESRRREEKRARSQLQVAAGCLFIAQIAGLKYI